MVSLTADATSLGEVSLTADLVSLTALSQEKLLLCPEGPIADPGDFNGTIGINSAVTVHSTDPYGSGTTLVKWGNDPKPIIEIIAKSCGDSIGNFAPVPVGYRIYRRFVQASGTLPQFGHVGTDSWVVDKTPTNGGEVGGRYEIYTDTGLHISEADPARPSYYGLKSAFSINCKQQVMLPGKLTPLPAAGSDFGGMFVFGMGSGQPGEAQIKFTLSGNTMLTTPEPGAYEVDQNGDHFITNAAGVRSRVMTEENLLSAIRAFLAG